MDIYMLCVCVRVCVCVCVCVCACCLKRLAYHKEIMVIIDAQMRKEKWTHFSTSTDPI